MEGTGSLQCLRHPQRKELMSGRARPPLRTVLFISLLGKGLTPRACMGTIESYSWAPVPAKCCHCQVFGNQTAILNFLLYYLTYVKIESKTAAYETTEKA